MKRLTLSRVAGANLRINRKAYLSLFLGILTAVYLATATSLCAWGVVRSHEEKMAEKVGWADMILPDSGDPTDAQLRRSGFFTDIGHITVTAAAENTRVFAGYYDETAEKLMNRTLKVGCLPEKAGEIAAEQSALNLIAPEGTAAGAVLSLTLYPAGGAAETRNYTLTGILNEQTSGLEGIETENGIRLPSLLFSPEEKPFEGGNSAVFRVLTYAPLITYNQVMRNCPLDLSAAYGVSRETGTVVWYDSGWDRATRTVERIYIWVILGAALMLSACVGITSAMENLLSRKIQDIGMLRAIGATRKQIRRVYSAEAWLLAATALPAGLLLGAATAWIISRLAPDETVFSLNAWLLIPILALSALCVFAASRFPLYRASFQMPIGVLRDSAVLRKTGMLRSRVPFTPSRLIAERRAGLHPLRHLGAAGMTALTLACALLLGELAMGLNLGDPENRPAFRIYSGGIVPPDAFTQMVPDKAALRGELNRIAGIDGVREVRLTAKTYANLLSDEVPEYFRPVSYTRSGADGADDTDTLEVLENDTGYGSEWLFYTPGELAEARADQQEDWRKSINVRCADRAEEIRAAEGISGAVIPITVYVIPASSAETLQQFVTDGSIDTGRLDSGEQALVYAPDICMRRSEDDVWEIERWLPPREIREQDWDKVIRNDAFSAGIKLSLLEIAQTYSLETQEYDGMAVYEPAEENVAYGDAAAVRADTAVGAVLAGPVRLNGLFLSGFAVIVTEKGAEAMGLILPDPDYTEVYLSGNPSPEKEALIEQEITRIVAQDRMSVDNQSKAAREYMQKKFRQMLLFGGLILLFFAVSVFMQVSGAARQIRSDTRTIGTLRAVGADLETLVGCYRLSAWICAGLGMILPVLFYTVCAVSGLRLFTAQHPLLILPLLAAMAACIALACIAGIRGRLAAVTRQPIVENIREL